MHDEDTTTGKVQDPLYYLYDGMGRVTELTKPTAQVSDKYRFDAFGVELPGGKMSPNAYKVLNNPFGYNGEQYDPEAGLSYLRNRYYEPETGRFMNRDLLPGYLMDPISMNAYAFVGNNPVQYMDPLGLDKIRHYRLFNPLDYAFPGDDIFSNRYGWIGGSQLIFLKYPFGGTDFYNFGFGQWQKLKWGRLDSDAVFGIDTGKSKLYLDYGSHKGLPEDMYHWNAKKGAASFYGINDHTPALGEIGAGESGALLSRGMQAAKIGSRGLIVVGAGMDIYQTVTSPEPVKTGLEKTGGWVGAWAGAKGGAAIGATFGSFVGPEGTAIGGAIGGIVGGIGGYIGARKL